jgi:hypothetical protein
LSYGELGSKYSKFDSPFLGRNREPDSNLLGNLADEFISDTDISNELTDDRFNSLVADYRKNLTLHSERVEGINDLVEAYAADVRKHGKISHDIGHQGKQSALVAEDDTGDGSAELGALIKKNIGSGGKGENYKSIATDKINIHPYGEDLPNDVSDFVKFKFYDIENEKHIIFRAILSGISDSITPEWSGTRYIGRPDQVYVYSGTERKISFTFEIYPKTKQEFPVLLEKMNYLVGLCYPSYTATNRMIAPFIELTLGDMFNRTPGFLDSLSVDVDDTSTWELDEGLQFPKHITCACSFTYVGKYLPSALGKHYELPWLNDQGWNADATGTALTKGTFEGDNGNPTRGVPMEKLFSDLGAPNDAE